jgi:hypothetical protein
MAKREIVIFSIMLASFYGCGNRTNVGKNDQDEFYNVTGGWDWVRVPLIKPYEVKKVDPEIKTNSWTIVLFDTLANLSNIENVKKVGVVDSTIFVLSGGDKDSTYFGGIKVAVAFHILNVKKKIERGFTSELEFNAYIDDNNYSIPSWYDIDSLSEALGNKGNLPWK